MYKEFVTPGTARAISTQDRATEPQALPTPTRNEYTKLGSLDKLNKIFKLMTTEQANKLV